jgi:hypothetical protein
MVSWYWKGSLRIRYNVSVGAITHFGDGVYFINTISLFLSLRFYYAYRFPLQSL